VFVGVLLTTISVSYEKNPSKSTSPPPTSYLTGIALLALALFLSGVLGITQDQAFAACSKKHGGSPPWKEAMFYIHALGLPLFLSSAGSLRDQFLGVMASKPTEHTLLDALSAIIPERFLGTFVLHDTSLRFRIPSALFPLVITLLTSLPCAAGANRLASSMTSTSVALVLAARKATSLLINTAVFGTDRVKSPGLMASGAVMVFVGSVGWAYAGVKPKGAPAGVSEEKKTQ
jgi:UDP-xylose/UDP-N-acetylglucosamine transporter B4